MQPTGNDAVVLEPLLDGLLHLLPHLLKVEPQAPVVVSALPTTTQAFALLHILPEAQALLVDILHYLRHRLVRIHLALRRYAHRHLALLRRQVAAAHTVHQPLVHSPPLAIQCLEEHPVGVERLHHVGTPHNLHLLRRQPAADGQIRMVPLARGGKRAIQRHAVACCPLGARGEQLRRTVRPHRVTAAGTIACFIYLLDGFHNCHY